MARKLRRGFIKESEEYAEEYRKELGLQANSPLNPVVLANHLEIPVHDLSTHPAISVKEKEFFLCKEPNLFSATTIADGNYREIIHNDNHHPNRQRSNIMHELAHIVLGHPPKPPMLDENCRNYDPIMEREASELSFILLIPKPAALHIVEEIKDISQAYELYGVSPQLMQYRLRKSDAKRWARNRALKAQVSA